MRGCSGEQFALPRAADALQAVRRATPTGRTQRVPATDLCNLTGTLLPGPRTPARVGEWVELPV